MIHLSDTIHFEQTKIYQKPMSLKKFALPVELLLLLLFLFCSACANSPGQPSALQAPQFNAETPDNSVATNSTINVDQEPTSCGRLTYPKYQDVTNQQYVAQEIQSGSAQIILHFHNLGQETLDAFLERTDGVLEIESQWPDWGAMSVTVNEKGLRQLSQDCAVRVIEANKREFPQ